MREEKVISGTGIPGGSSAGGLLGRLLKGLLLGWPRSLRDLAFSSSLKLMIPPIFDGIAFIFGLRHVDLRGEVGDRLQLQRNGHGHVLQGPHILQAFGGQRRVGGEQDDVLAPLPSPGPRSSGKY